MLHGADCEVETVVEDQAVRLGRRREGRKHLGRVDGEERDVQATEHRCRAHGCESCRRAQPNYLGRCESTGSTAALRTHWRKNGDAAKC